MDTLQYVAAVKAKRGITSDYALAKELGVSKQAVVQWNKGLCGFNETTSHRVAEILEIHPGLVMLDMQRHHAKTESGRDVWDFIYRNFRTLSLHANRPRALRPGLVTTA